MPKENRKRGKKHKKSEKEDEYAYLETANQVVEPEHGVGPSWIRPAEKDPNEFNPEAPFGYVDADVKAYFRTVDTQMRDWQENNVPEEGTEDTDPNEERRMFFVAALDEMREKEKQLATDPDCSVVLERMLHSMDDFVRRVFFDSLAGSFELLSKHRFGSHVVQTLFTIAADTIGREVRGVLPSVSGDRNDNGELRTLTQLVLDACKELLPVLSSLIIDPFASHVMRALLLLLSPTSVSEDESHSSVRSKRSSSWKAKQGSMKSLFEGKGKGKAEAQRTVPPQFTEVARRFVQTLRSSQDANEIRAIGASSVAGPCLKVFLEIEADEDMSEQPDSLMDRVMAGIITSYKTETAPEASDYVGTLLRDPTSSHLLETMVSRSPEKAFGIAWQLYFTGKLARLAAHPVANFVAAKALERLSPEQLVDAYDELKTIWHRSIQTARTGVLRAFVERAASLGIMKDEVTESIYTAFGFSADEDKSTLVLCILTLLTKEDYERALKSKNKEVPQPDVNSRKHHRGPKESDPLQHKTQGSILLQALVKMPESHNQFILDAIRELPMEHKIAIAHDPTGSRIYDALLESSTVSPKAKREFIMSFIGHYHELVDDRIGSRVGDRCWASSDTYLKEKVARSLIPFESSLSGSFYGKFFARNLNLFQLQRRPDEWRNMQSQKKQNAQGQTIRVSTAPHYQKQHQEQATSTKKRSKPSDEIEELFDKTLGKRTKKAALSDGLVETGSNAVQVKEKKAGKDATGLDAVFGAIKSAPKHEDGHRPKKKHRST